MFGASDSWVVASADHGLWFADSAVWDVTRKFALLRWCLVEAVRGTCRLRERGRFLFWEDAG